jgi:hypothetical protein
MLEDFMDLGRLLKLSVFVGVFCLLLWGIKSQISGFISSAQESQLAEQNQKEVQEQIAKGPELPNNNIVHLYVPFCKAFDNLRNQSPSLGILKQQIALAEEARAKALILRSEITNPKEERFLSRFIELLEEYGESTKRYVAEEEENEKLPSAIAQTKKALETCSPSEQKELSQKLLDLELRQRSRSTRTYSTDLENSRNTAFELTNLKYREI